MKFLTMHSCKGLEFPLVAIPEVGNDAGDERIGGGWRVKIDSYRLVVIGLRANGSVFPLTNAKFNPVLTN